MASSSGKLGAVYVGGVAVAEIRDWSVEQTGDTTESSVMGTEWRTHLATLKSWTSSFNAFWDLDDAAQASLDVGAEVTLALYPTGNTSTEKYYTGSAIVTSVSSSASFDGMIEASFTVQGTGALTESTVA